MMTDVEIAMNIEQASAKAKELGMCTRIRDESTLHIFTGVDESREISLYENCHIVREVNGKWCVYDGGQAPIDEFGDIEDAVIFAIGIIKSNL